MTHRDDDDDNDGDDHDDDDDDVVVAAFDLSGGDCDGDCQDHDGSSY